MLIRINKNLLILIYKNIIDLNLSIYNVCVCVYIHTHTQGVPKILTLF